MSEQVLQTPAKRNMKFPIGAVILLVYVALSGLVVTVVNFILPYMAMDGNMMGGGVRQLVFSLMGYLGGATGGILCIVLAILLLAKKHGPILAIPCFGMAAVALENCGYQAAIASLYMGQFGYDLEYMLDNGILAGVFFKTLYHILAQEFLLYVWIVLALLALMCRRGPVVRRVFRIIATVVMAIYLPWYALCAVLGDVFQGLFQSMMYGQGVMMIRSLIMIALTLILAALYIVALFNIKSWIANPYLDGEPVEPVVESKPAEPAAPVAPVAAPAVEAAAPVAPAAPALDDATTAESLVTYKKLLDQGVITQEEFDAKKKQLLNL